MAGIAYYFLKPEQAKAQLHKIESEADHLKAKGEKVLADAKSQAKDAVGSGEHKVSLFVVIWSYLFKSDTS